ncbi:MAG: ornithine cyclodeaminase family protein, partial [Cyanobacteria bacterium J06627_28]
QFAEQASIGPELFEVIKQPTRYVNQQRQLSVFDSTGFALEDQVAMNMMLDYAKALDLGSWVSLESAAADVKNPYGFVVGG